VLLGALVYLGLQLRARVIALRRRAAFEHVIAGISMRFINAHPQNIDAEKNRAARAPRSHLTVGFLRLDEAQRDRASLSAEMRRIKQSLSG
jgi:hypothetical protein